MTYYAAGTEVPVKCKQSKLRHILKKYIVIHEL